jgi:hypothetical protein
MTTKRRLADFAIVFVLVFLAIFGLVAVIGLFGSLF